MLLRHLAFASLLGLPISLPAQDPIGAWLDREGERLGALYRDLHEHPELSFREVKTAARMAAELRALGFEVTERVGGNGVVGVLRRGEGPVALLRADMDALPVAEQTGLPYASKIRAESAEGRAVGVMHGCGHDLHMTCLLGCAGYLAAHQDAFAGTVVFVFQPAEERSGGMDKMLADGLLERFPRADFALALHCSADLPVGTIGLRTGPSMANVDSVDITLFGKGGHGAAPHLTIDPIVEAARLVLDLQTIVAREIDPVEPAVITVGSIHAGEKHNIVPASCHLQLTVRSYSDAVRKQLAAAIRRKVAATAASSGAREPVIEFSEGTPALYNDERLTGIVRDGLAAAFGSQQIVAIQPAMTAEDFGRLRGAGVPLCMFRLGTVAPERLAAMQAKGDVPGLHSGGYYPDYDGALRVGVRALVEALRAAAKAK